ncbi:hypothetical protein [Spirochaeta cellobiosiphila]|nr:hypothetical protein [Spirochaeta cellobiosiphila]
MDCGLSFDNWSHFRYFQTGALLLGMVPWIGGIAMGNHSVFPA